MGTSMQGTRARDAGAGPGADREVWDAAPPALVLSRTGRDDSVWTG